ncbi:patatin-like phospholipase family protein [Actinokineospora iranica]|uniref:NTE family protein n=1 Tax=Actinokineospora iranica TaxID=1271860 RepID=A0A1G6LGL5_9PSEU|nr:patatin-like phospholipase family protein [Actinokineospora iranica]SDC41895.1 NTE family protein [Actinokineospora iranica]
MTRRGLVVGCGGTVGFAWSVAALHSLSRDLAWDPRSAEVMVGTSAGAELVAILAAGFTVDDVLAALTDQPHAPALLRDHFAACPGALPPVPALGFAAPRLPRVGAHPLARLAGLLPLGRGDQTWLHRLGDALAPQVAHRDTLLVAADRDTGERVVFDAATGPLGPAIAASWAIPGWFPPVEIGGRAHIDGGVLSPTSADLLVSRGLDEVVVIAPMTSAGPAPARGLSRLERLLRRPMSRLLDAEAAALRAAGTVVHRIEPGPEDLAAMGPNFMDPRRALSTVETALRVRAPR